MYEIPIDYPSGYLFGGGKPVEFLMVDWFNPWPTEYEGRTFETWQEVVEVLKPLMAAKAYVKPGRRYIMITDFNETMIFSKEDLK